MLEHLLDEYITKEEYCPPIGRCENCGDLTFEGSDYSKLNGVLFCGDDCINQYFEVEEHTVVEYCDGCNYPVEENYIIDVYGNQFCDIDCLKKFYMEV